jgi:branched-subunit amino acid aminotransferase/4-amino-4-deoxychorismate lyase
MDFPFLIYNGEVVSRNHPIPMESLLNRGLYYGDGFFDTQFLEDGLSIRNWEFHKNRLIHSFEQLGLKAIEALLDPAKYQKMIAELAQKNEFHFSKTSSILRIQCWRLGGRGYMSRSSEVAYLIECFEAPISKKDVKVSTYTLANSLRAGIPSTLKSSSAYTYVRIANETEGETVVLVDSQKNALEGLNTSLFWIRGNTLFAPKQTDHLLMGVSRMFLTQLCEDHGYLFEEKSLSLNEIAQQDVVFLSNAIYPFCVITKWDQLKLPVHAAFLDEIKDAYSKTTKKYSLDIY